MKLPQHIPLRIIKIPRYLSPNDELFTLIAFACFSKILLKPIVLEPPARFLRVHWKLGISTSVAARFSAEVN